MPLGEILPVLALVADPEIPVLSVLDLGIIRGMREDPPTLLITPTYSGCPATHAIESAIRKALDEAGFQAVGIETVLNPPWTTDWITAAGAEKLRAYGIAPPTRDPKAQCPQCTGRDTVEISRFGSTPCKALWQCRTCGEPFDRFKCH